ncbi:MFS transporter [Nonomuraea sp. NPDC001699]
MNQPRRLPPGSAGRAGGKASTAGGTPADGFAAAPDGSTLAVLLLVFGLAGTAGNLTAGRLADRYGPRRVVVTVMLSLAVALVLTPLGRDALAAAVATVVVIGFLSLSVTAPLAAAAAALTAVATRRLPR